MKDNGEDCYHLCSFLGLEKYLGRINIFLVNIFFASLLCAILTTIEKKAPIENTTDSLPLGVFCVFFYGHRIL